MSRLLDRIRKEAWDERREFGREGRRPRDTRLVALWFRKGKIESMHLDALDWLQRRVEAGHARGMACGERIACTRAPDGPTTAQMDALNDVAGALAAVRTKAGGLCERALYILTAEPQIKKTDLRQVLTCKMDKVELIVAHALETLAIYRAECEVERLRWNRRPFVP